MVQYITLDTFDLRYRKTLSFEFSPIWNGPIFQKHFQEEPFISMLFLEILFFNTSVFDGGNYFEYENSNRMTHKVTKISKKVAKYLWKSQRLNSI